MSGAVPEASSESTCGQGRRADGPQVLGPRVGGGWGSWEESGPQGGAGHRGEAGTVLATSVLAAGPMLVPTLFRDPWF